ncbi:hypothetical protein EYF80_004997 [Liparis tanakae]|uniref:Uncharacterized protein n=1 Tax=Liparis tanakae TaxID=230148 RepID=A0A4Z2J628_9TELE|nr:hypothetical protein EYF80_004997 [Liparis tanakae]
MALAASAERLKDGPSRHAARRSPRPPEGAPAAARPAPRLALGLRRLRARLHGGRREEDEETRRRGAPPPPRVYPILSTRGSCTAPPLTPPSYFRELGESFHSRLHLRTESLDPTGGMKEEKKKMLHAPHAFTFSRRRP